MPDKKMFQKSFPSYVPMILDLHHFLNLLSSGNFDITDSSKRNTETIRISQSPQRMIKYFILTRFSMLLSLLLIFFQFLLPDIL